MPDILWPVFLHNRDLLGEVSRLASEALLQIADHRKIKIGIFGALHTFGRRLNWNVHTHLSVTRGGVCHQHGHWKKIYFPKAPVMNAWRTKLVGLLRERFDDIELPKSLASKIHNDQDWSRMLDGLYKGYWHIHFAKKTKQPQRTINYLGRYLKRPTIAASRLKHDNGQDVTFRFLNHNTGEYENLTLSQEDMIIRIIPPSFK